MSHHQSLSDLPLWGNWSGRSGFDDGALLAPGVVSGAASPLERVGVAVGVTVVGALDVVVGVTVVGALDVVVGVTVPPGWVIGGLVVGIGVTVPPGWVIGGLVVGIGVTVPPGWVIGGLVVGIGVTVPPGWVIGGLVVGIGVTVCCCIGPGNAAAGVPSAKLHVMATIATSMWIEFIVVPFAGIIVAC